MRFLHVIYNERGKASRCALTGGGGCNPRLMTGDVEWLVVEWLSAEASPGRDYGGTDGPLHGYCRRSRYSDDGHALGIPAPCSSAQASTARRSLQRNVRRAWQHRLRISKKATSTGAAAQRLELTDRLQMSMRPLQLVHWQKTLACHPKSMLSNLWAYI